MNILIETLKSTRKTIEKINIIMDETDAKRMSAYSEIEKAATELKKKFRT